MSPRSILAVRSAALVLPALLLLAACTPGDDRGRGATPEPSATIAPPTTTPTVTPAPAASTPAGPPPLGDLVLSRDGLGTLVVGEPFDLELARFDPHGCLTEGNESYLEHYPADDPIWEAWLPNYPPVPFPWGGETYEVWPFELHHDEGGNLSWLRIRSEEIRTEKGIGLGSTEEELLAAYPDAERGEAAGRQRLYIVTGTRGRLLLDVSSGTTDLPVEAGTVWDVRVQPLEWRAGSLAYGDGGGFCALGV